MHRGMDDRCPEPLSRRRYLTLAGAALIAGCNTGETADPTPAPADTQTDERGPEATITSEQLSRVERQGWEQIGATGSVENTGSAYLGWVQVTAEFFDGGALLTSGSTDMRSLAPGEVWEPWVRYVDRDVAVESAELRVSRATAKSRTHDPEQLSADTDLRIPQNAPTQTRVVGEVSNTGDAISYLEARPKVYAANGNVIATGIQTLQGVGAGESRTIDVVTPIVNPEWADRAADHTVVLAL